MTSGFTFAQSVFPQVTQPVPAGTSCLQAPSFIDSLGRLTCTVTPKTCSDLRVQKVPMIKWVMKTQWKRDDGGRAAAGFKGETGDCVTRAIAIATGIPYREVYDGLKAEAKRERPRGKRKRSSVRDGVAKPTIRRYLTKLGWTWTPTMHIGSGCKVHLDANELPQGRLIVSVSKHMCAVIDGVIHDTFDPRRPAVGFTNGVSDPSTMRETRCVYGYWSDGSSTTEGGD